MIAVEMVEKNNRKKFKTVLSLAIIANVCLFIASIVLFILYATADNQVDNVYGKCNDTDAPLVINNADGNIDSRVYYDFKTRQLKVYSVDKNIPRITGDIGLQVNTGYLKNVNVQSSSDELKFSFVSKLPSFAYANSSLTIKRNNKGSSNIECHTYNWIIEAQNESPNNQKFEDCFNLAGSYWYGGAEAYRQQFWPINDQMFETYKPYLTGLFGVSSSVLERYWLSSSGAAIIVDPAVPLFVKMNRSSICFLANIENPYSKNQPINMKYDICTIDKRQVQTSFLKDLHLHVINKYFKIPSGIPDKLMFQRPIWSTWANFKRDINESVLLSYADEINAHDYQNSQLEIDDQWATNYGDFYFNTMKFPDMKSTIKKLNDKSFRTTLWIHPFANAESTNYLLKAFDFFWVRGPDGLYPALTGWWNGLAAGVLDTTNPNATDWFVSELEGLRKNYGIDSFKFDAGNL